jgi:hypothetical protein
MHSGVGMIYFTSAWLAVMAFVSADTNLAYNENQVQRALTAAVYRAEQLRGPSFEQDEFVAILEAEINEQIAHYPHKGISSTAVTVTDDDQAGIEASVVLTLNTPLLDIFGVRVVEMKRSASWQE